MAITASSNSGTPRELIPAGNYIARCYQMIHIGTVEEVIMGEKKILNKVRIGWEMPLELRVFKEEKGEQPLVISKEYTLSLHEKSSLRAMLKSWRGKDFTEEQAKAFDITALLGVPCLLNIGHKPSKKDASKVYEEISAVTAIPKGTTVPPQINPTFELDYDQWDEQKFNSLPDFIKNKMKTSIEYAAVTMPEHKEMEASHKEADVQEEESDLPF